MFEKTYKIPQNTLNGRVSIVTGSNSGIGRETAKAMLRAGCTVFMACRNDTKAKEAMERVLNELAQELPSNDTFLDNLKFLKLDLVDLDSVRQCAKEFLSFDLPLHYLINNAGLASADNKVSKEGLEESFAVCHLGHFLLTSLLWQKLVQSSSAVMKSRIVNVSSVAHFSVDAIDYNLLKNPKTGDGLRAQFASYSVSKFANVLFTQELARRSKILPVLVYSLMPGAVATDIWRNMWVMKTLANWFMLSEEVGSNTTNYCATSPDLESKELSGGYYDNCSLKACSKSCTPEKATELWQKSLEWCKIEEFLPPM